MFELSQKLIPRGLKGIISLTRLFRIHDDDNSLHIELIPFIKVFEEFRFAHPFSKDELKILFDAFDRDHSGIINYRQFLRVLRGPFQENRK